MEGRIVGKSGRRRALALPHALSTLYLPVERAPVAYLLNIALFVCLMLRERHGAERGRLRCVYACIMRHVAAFWAYGATQRSRRRALAHLFLMNDVPPSRYAYLASSPTFAGGTACLPRIAHCLCALISDCFLLYLSAFHRCPAYRFVAAPSPCGDMDAQKRCCADAPCTRFACV